MVTTTARSLQTDGPNTWTDTDGTQGIAQPALGPSLATHYAWMNPDGYQTLYEEALHGRKSRDAPLLATQR